MDLTALPVEGRGAGLQASAESQMMGANLNQREMALVIPPAHTWRFGRELEEIFLPEPPACGAGCLSEG